MKPLLVILSLALTATLTRCADPKPCIHIIGGTTVCPCDANTTQACGWGQILTQIVPSDVTCVNHAKMWATVQSFYEDGSWQEAKQQLRPGDFLLIQFAHDDERSASPDNKGNNSPWTTFRQGLIRYIDEARQVGTTPILVQPIVRRIFEGNSISARGTHNFSRCAGDDSLNVTSAIRHIADSLNVQVIDLCTMSKNITEAYGIADSKEQLYVASDNTNTSAKGAALFAIAVAEVLDTMNIWSSHLDTPPVVASEQEINMGDVFIGDTAWQVVDIVDIEGLSTRHVLNHRKQITILAPAGFKISRSPGSTPKDSLQFFTNTPAQIVVCYAPSSTTPSAGNLKITTPSGSAYIKVGGKGEYPQRKDQITVNWQDVNAPLDNSTFSLRLSSIRGLELTANGVMPIGGIWSTDPTNGEYVQLKLINKEKYLRVSNISLTTTSSQQYSIKCALGYDFFRNLTVGQRDANLESTSNAPRTDSFNTSIHLAPGQAMLIRLHLASSATSLALPFHISNVAITADIFE